MAERKDDKQEQSEQKPKTTPHPSKAEGSEETVDEALRNQEKRKETEH